MSSTSEFLRKYAKAIVGDVAEAADDAVRARPVIERTLFVTATQLFSSDAIGLAASKLDGDRVLALRVIASAFSAVAEQKPETSSCPETCAHCGGLIEVTISGFSLNPKLEVCPNCGVLKATAADSV